MPDLSDESRLGVRFRAVGNMVRLMTRERDPEKLIQGACRQLTEALGYTLAWIAVRDSQGRLERAAGAGLGGGFGAVRARLERSEALPCEQRLRGCAGGAAMLSPRADCAGCPLAGCHANTVALAQRLEYAGRDFGMLVVGLPAAVAGDPEETSMVAEMAGDVAFALHGIESDLEVRSLARFPAESPNPILRIGSDGKVLYANAASEPILAAWGSWVGAAAPEEWRVRVALVLADGRPAELETRLGYRVFSCIFAPSGGASGVNVFARDITERWMLQEKLRTHAAGLEQEVAGRTAEIRASEAKYRALFHGVYHAIVVTDARGRVLDCNPAAERLLGRTAEDLRGRSAGAVLGIRPSRQDRKALDRRLRERGAWNCECVCRAAGGKELPLQLSISAIRGESGSPEGMVWIAADLSERESLEERLRRTGEYAGAVLRGSGPQWDLVGCGGHHRRMVGFVREAAEVPSPVLVLGESGTGKEMVSRAIHANSPRREKPFVVVDCSTLTASLLENELFGHEKGAFTGAGQARAGLVEVADGGTLFVDEIGDLPLELQPKLLRVLDRGEFRRLGSTRERRSDVRLVAATNRDLKAEVRGGRFRKDLFYRLNVLSVTLPPLRERPEDVPVLAQHFLENTRVTVAGEKRFRPEALECLQAYVWPGNVRELANIVERAVILSRERPEIGPQHLPPEIRKAPGRGGTRVPVRTIKDVEKEAIALALEATGWNKTRAAEKLGIARITLREKIARYGLANPRRGDARPPG